MPKMRKNFYYQLIACVLAFLFAFLWDNTRAWQTAVGTEISHLILTDAPSVIVLTMEKQLICLSLANLHYAIHVMMEAGANTNVVKAEYTWREPKARPGLVCAQVVFSTLRWIPPLMGQRLRRL